MRETSEPSSKLEGALNNHLPPYWSDSWQRRHQIVAVVEAFLRQPRNLGTQDRLVHATKEVARDRGILFNTVQDKYGRQLYGHGQLTSRFRDALEKIEPELRS